MPQTEPFGSGRPRDIRQNLQPDVLKIIRSPPSGVRGCDHRVRYPLARVVTVLVHWNPLADIRQRGRHVGHHVLIELDQHRLHLRPRSLAERR